MSESNGPGPAAVTAGHIFRRRYLIDPKRQLRTAIMTTSAATALVILANLGFGMLWTNQTSFLSAVAPQLEPVIEAQETTILFATAALSVAVVLLVLVKTIVETHRTAGAVFAVRQRIERVAAGDLRVNLRLRRNDNLGDLVEPFNRMVASLRDRAETEASELEEMATRAMGLGAAGAELADRLRSIARRRDPAGGDQYRE